MQCMDECQTTVWPSDEKFLKIPVDPKTIKTPKEHVPLCHLCNKSVLRPATKLAVDVGFVKTGIQEQGYHLPKLQPLLLSPSLLRGPLLNFLEKNGGNF